MHRCTHAENILWPYKIATGEGRMGRELLSCVKVLGGGKMQLPILSTQKLLGMPVQVLHFTINIFQDYLQLQEL